MKVDMPKLQFHVVYRRTTGRIFILGKEFVRCMGKNIGSMARKFGPLPLCAFFPKKALFFLVATCKSFIGGDALRTAVPSDSQSSKKQSKFFVVSLQATSKKV